MSISFTIGISISICVSVSISTSISICVSINITTFLVFNTTDPLALSLDLGLGGLGPRVS